MTIRRIEWTEQSAADQSGWGYPADGGLLSHCVKAGTLLIEHQRTLVGVQMSTLGHRCKDDVNGASPQNPGVNQAVPTPARALSNTDSF